MIGSQETKSFNNNMEMYFGSFFGLLCACVLLSYVFREQPTDSNYALVGSGRNSHAAYLAFRRNYLLVYLCMMMGDWLQGPYVYALYKNYGYGLEDISVLFIAGFFSSALFGTVISSLADRYGRKLMCCAFCIIYSSSCLTKLSSNFQVLLMGRILGGIATSLLFSVFEAWMVSEHHSRGFAEDLLSATFSWATFGNGLVAIASGVLANASVDLTSSFVAPFMLSMLFLLFGLVIVLKSWKENYGERQPSDSPNSPSYLNAAANDEESSQLSLVEGLKIVMSDIRILSTGMIVSLFEGSMYTFVFLWGPVLEKGDTNTPFGLIFAAFMVCIMIGSILFRVSLRFKLPLEVLIQPVLLLGAIALAIPTFSGNNYVAFWAFNIFELCCGMYFPIIGTLRSKYVPEETRATIMNIFRVPLNLIVVMVLLRVAEWSPEFIFGICSCLLLVAFCFSAILAKKRTTKLGSAATSGLLH